MEVSSLRQKVVPEPGLSATMSLFDEDDFRRHSLPRADFTTRDGHNAVNVARCHHAGERARHAYEVE